MIELPRACVRADEIAETADFFSFGTNDLTQTALGFSRDDAEGKFLTYYLEHGILERNPFEMLDQEGVGELMRIAVERGRGAKPDLKLGICGEHGGEPRSVAFCHGLGLDYVSCSPYRVPLARLAAAQARSQRAGRRDGSPSAADERIRLADARVTLAASLDSLDAVDVGTLVATSSPPSVPRSARARRARADGAHRAAGERGHRRAPRPVQPHARSRAALPRPVRRPAAEAARRPPRAGGRLPAASGDHAGQRDDLDRHGLLLHDHRPVPRDVRGRAPPGGGRAADRHDAAQRDRLALARGDPHVARQDQRRPPDRARRGDRALGHPRQPDRAEVDRPAELDPGGDGEADAGRARPPRRDPRGRGREAVADPHGGGRTSSRRS